MRVIERAAKSACALDGRESPWRPLKRVEMRRYDERFSRLRRFGRKPVRQRCALDVGLRRGGAVAAMMLNARCAVRILVVAAAEIARGAAIGVAAWDGCFGEIQREDGH